MSGWWETETRVFLGHTMLWRQAPVFHRRRPFTDREVYLTPDGKVFVSRTVCGRIHTQLGDALHISSVDMLTVHAEKIGRPCKQCFPQVPQS